MVVFKKLSSEFIKEVGISWLTFMSYTMVGVCRGYTPFITSQLREPDSPIKLTKDEESWIASLTILPDPIGCLIGGILVDVIGRKKALISIFIPFSIAWCIVALATNTWMLYIGTIFNGIASGMTYCSATYIAEIGRPENRGFLLTLLEPTLTLGVLFSNLVAHFLKWELAAVVYLVLSISIFFALFILPESPTYLVGKNRIEDAVKILSWIRGNKNEAEKEISEMVNYYDELNANKRNFGSLVIDCLSSWKPLLIVIGVCILQQGSGYQIMLAYTTTFFEELNIPFDNPFAVIIYSSVSFVVSFVSPIVAHQWGRKPLLAMSGLGMGVFLSVAAAYESVFLDEEDKPFFWIVLLSVYAYCVALTLGVMIMPFLIVGEVFRPQVRGIMCGINGVFTYIITGIAVKFFPWYLSEFGIIGVLWTLVIISLFNVPYAKYLLPETQGKTLSEIQEKYFPLKGKKNNEDERL